MTYDREILQSLKHENQTIIISIFILKLHTL